MSTSMVTFHCQRCKYNVSVKDRTTGLKRLRQHYWKKHRAYMIQAIKKGKAKKKTRMLEDSFSISEAVFHSARMAKTASQWPQMTREQKIKAVSEQVADLVVDYLD